MGVDPPYYQRDIALIPKLLDFHTGTRTQTHTHIASYGGVVHLKRGYREVCILNYHSLQILRYIQPIGRTCNPPPPNLTRTIKSSTTRRVGDDDLPSDWEEANYSSGDEDVV